MIRRQDDSKELLESRQVPGKGLGIFARQPIPRGRYVCEYAGELLNKEQTRIREKEYEEEAKTTPQEEMMCYMYYFKYNNHDWW